MGKRIKKCPKNCPKHAFSLKPVHYSALFSRQLSACFCPTSRVKKSITPRFNNDKRYFTVSFYIPADRQMLSKNEDFFKTDHEKYKLDYASEKSNIFQPKPKSKYSYCNVCKLDYDDYLEHIRSVDHKKIVNQNRFNQCIGQICEQMKNKIQQTFQKQQFSEENEIQFPSLSLFLTQGWQMNKETSLPLGSSFKKRFEPLTLSKSFHAFSSYNQQKNLFPAEQPELPMTNTIFSPMKRCSEVTEGVRIVSNIRPIILFGSQNNINF